MKRRFLLLGLISVLTFSCGGEVSKEAKEDKELKIESFSKEKLQGEWEVIQAYGESAEKYKGTTIKFVGDSITMFMDWGVEGFGTAYCTYRPGIIEAEFTQLKENGDLSFMGIFYKGGFKGDQLEFKSNSQELVLKRKK